MRDAQLVMPKAVSAAMAAWITARRICVQVISWIRGWIHSWKYLFFVSLKCEWNKRRLRNWRTDTGE